MRTEYFELIGSDGTALQAVLWQPETPRAVLQNDRAYLLLNEYLHHFPTDALRRNDEGFLVLFHHLY